MDAIIFYNGEEKEYIIEKNNLTSSIFKEQYERALRLIQDIVNNPNNTTPSIVSFCGDRGEGKTSCMRTIMYLLEDASNKSIKELYKNWNIVDKKFEVLEVIDPIFFDKEHNVIQLLLGQLYADYIKKLDKVKNKCEEAEKLKPLGKAFQRTTRCLAQIKHPREKFYNTTEDLEALAAAKELQKSIDNLIKEYLSVAEKDFLVISIDDIDLNIKGAYEMVEQIRKYLLSKQCILFVSLHINQLINVVATYLDKEDSPHNRLETEDMATKYVTKLIPLDNRVIMPKTYDFCDKRLQIYKTHEDSDASATYNSVKEAVVQLIYNKTRYLFYNSKGGVSPIVPNNLRSLRHLIGLLYNMENFVNNATSEANKHAFKAYFFQTWIYQLDKKDQKFANLLGQNNDTSLINKQIVSYLAENNRERISTNENNSLLTNIIQPDNYSYNISVGDVFYLTNFLEKSNVKEELRLLLFFIKSYYSIRLYECYDIITEKSAEIFPEPQFDGEIFKSDALFNRVNILQKLLNGAYFTYNPGNYLPMSNAETFRDLKVISAKVLRDNLYTDWIDNMKKFSDGTLGNKEMEVFKQKFRMMEFFAITSKRSVPQKQIGNFERMKRNNPEPYHLSPFNINTGYIVFDIMAPFTNIVNLKYAYGRYSYLHYDNNWDFYEFAYQNKWSLLRRMMEYVDLKEYNEEHPEAPKDISTKTLINDEDLKDKFFRLISNASIRNAEVLSAMTEMITSRRFDYHGVNDNARMIADFYKSIINSEMRTYKNNDSQKPYVIRFAFLEAIIELLNTNGDLFKRIYETDSSISLSVIQQKFYQFYNLNFTRKARKGIVSELRKIYGTVVDTIPQETWNNIFPDEQKQHPKNEIMEIFRKNYDMIRSLVPEDVVK